MDAGLDTGAMLLQKEYSLTPLETSQTLHDKLAQLSVPLLLESLALIENGKATFIPQDNHQAVYATKITKAEGKIDWKQSAKTIALMVRAFNPWPVAHTRWHEEDLRIWLASAEDKKTALAPGCIVEVNKKGISIATGDGVLHLLQVQLPGGKILSGAEFSQAKAQQLMVGERFS
jgi:methionyl-tRNA formyltransferase